MTHSSPLPMPRQVAFWVILTIGLILLVWLLRGMLLPFVLGMSIAYVCDPFADRLEALGVPRWGASLLVLGLVVGGAALVLVLVAPVIVDQIAELAQQAPHYIDYLRHKLLPRLTRFATQVGGPGEVADMRNAVSSYAGDISGWVLSFLGKVLNGGLAVANIVYVMALTPLVAFYFLRDWDLMVAKIDSWMPRRHIGVIRYLAHEINDILAGFIRGQATVCLIFAIYYSAALSTAGLNFAIIIGIGAGILTFIPYLGAITGLAASLVVAFIQFNDYTRIGIVAVVYLAGHLVEANIVTPLLVGGRVKLHPVWIIFALAAGGALFGLTGVLLAVPAAAVIGVLIRFLIKQYLDSGFYDNNITPLPLVDPSEL
jgi:predicted PurR-regulated permease PerM